MKHPANQIRLLFLGSILGLVVWALSPPVYAGYDTKPSEYMPLTEYEATYVVSWHGIKGGESNHRLIRRPDNVYHVESTTAPYIKFLPIRYVEKADFTWDGTKIIPQNYYYNMKEGRRHKQGNVFFDYEKQKVANVVSHEPWEAKIVDDLQDKLTHTLMLRMDLLKGNKKSYTYIVAEDDEIKPYTFKTEETEILQTNIGTLKALKISHQSRKDRTTYMWLSVNHDYLPIKVEHYRNGKKVGSGEIKKYQPKPKQKT